MHATNNNNPTMTFTPTLKQPTRPAAYFLERGLHDDVGQGETDMSENRGCADFIRMFKQAIAEVAAAKQKQPAIDSHKMANIILSKRKVEHLRYWHGSWYQYTGTHYIRLEGDEVKPSVNGDLAQILNLMKRGTNVTRSMVSNVIGAMEAKRVIPGTVAINQWIESGRPAVDIVPVKNGLVNIGTGKLVTHNPDFFN